MEAIIPILYFSLFDYPLTCQEIFQYSRLHSKEVTKSQLELLIEQKIITRKNDFYIYGDDKQVDKRILGAAASKIVAPKALKNAKLISKFPFVKGVAFSGSFSKNYHGPDSDIDFFIITEANRLWICRSFLILYKKIFLLNSRKYFCVNYFISSDKLEIEEKNRFTATELVSLKIPFSQEIFNNFFEQNKWAFHYFNRNIPCINKRKVPFSRLSKMIEFLLSGQLGDILDQFCMYATIKKWKSKFGHMDKDQFQIALKSTKNISKHHPRNFQKKIIDALNEKISDVNEQYKMKIAHEDI